MAFITVLSLATRDGVVINSSNFVVPEGRGVHKYTLRLDARSYNVEDLTRSVTVRIQGLRRATGQWELIAEAVFFPGPLAPRTLFRDISIMEDVSALYSSVNGRCEVHGIVRFALLFEEL